MKRIFTIACCLLAVCLTINTAYSQKPVTEDSATIVTENEVNGVTTVRHYRDGEAFMWVWHNENVKSDLTLGTLKDFAEFKQETCSENPGVSTRAYDLAKQIAMNIYDPVEFYITRESDALQVVYFSNNGELSAKIEILLPKDENSPVGVIDAKIGDVVLVIGEHQKSEFYSDSFEAEKKVFADQNFLMDDITLYPNPASDKLNVGGLTDNMVVLDIIHVVTGKFINRLVYVPGESIDISRLSSGSYSLRFSALNGDVLGVKSFVKVD